MSNPFNHINPMEWSQDQIRQIPNSSQEVYQVSVNSGIVNEYTTTGPRSLSSSNPNIMSPRTSGKTQIAWETNNMPNPTNVNPSDLQRYQTAIRPSLISANSVTTDPSRGDTPNQISWYDSNGSTSSYTHFNNYNNGASFTSSSNGSSNIMNNTTTNNNNFNSSYGSIYSTSGQPGQIHPATYIQNFQTHNQPLNSTTFSQPFHSGLSTQPHSQVAPNFGYQLNVPTSYFLSHQPIQANNQNIKHRSTANVDDITERHNVTVSTMTESRIQEIIEAAVRKSISEETVRLVVSFYTEEGRRGLLGLKDENEKVDRRVEILTNGRGGEEDLNEELCRKRAHRKIKPHHIKRPLNAFMMYRKAQTKKASQFRLISELKINHQVISQILGLLWRTEDEQVQKRFQELASREKDIHRILYPQYKFSPQKKLKKSAPDVESGSARNSTDLVVQEELPVRIRELNPET